MPTPVHLAGSAVTGGGCGSPRAPRRAAGAERGVVRGVLQRVRRRLLAALEPLTEVAPEAAAGGHRPGRRLPDQGRRLARSSCAAWCSAPAAGTSVDLALDLRPFEDGGWYWFDLTTDDDELILHAGGWYAAVEARRPGRGDDRHADVQPARRLRRHADRDRRGPAGAGGGHRGDPADQGTQKVRDEPGFAAAAAALGDKLRIIDQPNLGGSGGYARVMYEALATPRLRADPVHGRRHPARAGLGAARRRVLPVRPRADAGRRADAVAAGPLAAVDDGRGRRPQHVPLAQRPEHRAAPRPGRAHAAHRRRGCTGASTSTTTPGGCA